MRPHGAGSPGQRGKAADRLYAPIRPFLRRGETDDQRRHHRGRGNGAFQYPGPSIPKPWMYDISKSNGPLAEVNSHDIGTLRWFTGSDFKTVFAIGGHFRCPDAKKDFPDFYDNVVLNASFINGCKKNQPKMRFFAPLSAVFSAYNRLLSTTSANSPDGRNAACTAFTAQAAFFRKAFSLPTAPQNKGFCSSIGTIFGIMCGTMFGTMPPRFWILFR